MDDLSLKAFFSKKSPKGIANHGSTCYVNSFFQCLNNCLVFTHEIIKNKETSSPILSKMREFFLDYWFSDKKELNIMLLLKITSVKLEMNLFRQNDVHEFLILFFDKINGEIGEIIEDKEEYKKYFQKNKDSGNDLYDRLLFCSEKFWYQNFKKEYSFLVNLFYGMKINQIICGNCNKKSHSYEVMSTLALPISEQCDNLLDCFKLEFNKEEINDWRCDFCKEKSPSLKTSKFWKLPKYLIIILKSYCSKKKSVKLVNNLNLSEIVINEKETGEYTLNSFSNHMGAMNFGHYTSTIKHPSGEFYNINDEYVSQLGKNIDCSNAYLIVYEKIN